MTDPATTDRTAPGAVPGEDERRSYVDRHGFNSEDGYELDVGLSGQRVSIVLGETRRSGGFVGDAWADLTVAEARELAADLMRFAGDAEIVARHALSRATEQGTGDAGRDGEG